MPSSSSPWAAEIEKNISVIWSKPSLIRDRAKIFGIVRRDGGYGKVADTCLIVPTVNPDT
jgi:hypothetical protein